MRDFRKLDVWTIARDFAVSVYDVSARFPAEEKFGLTSQIRRASVSIASNIAEGVGRDSDAELLRFVRISLGSLNEVETQLEIAYALKFVQQSDFEHTLQASRDLGVRLRNFATRLSSDLESQGKATQSNRKATHS